MENLISVEEGNTASNPKYLPPVNSGKKFNLEFRNSISYVIFFSANFHLMSLFYRIIIRKIL